MEAEPADSQDIEAFATVALSCNMPDFGLLRGQVGTIVETLDAQTFLVEFSDDEGRAYAVAPCLHDALLPLVTAPIAA